VKFGLVVFSECELAVTCPSVVCLFVTLVHPTQAVEIFGNVSTPFGTLYLGHPLISTENFTAIVPREPLRRGFKRKRGSQI